MMETRCSSGKGGALITDQLLGEHIFGGHIASADLVSVREQLAEWSAGRGGFLLSIRSRRSYYKLRDALRVAYTKELSEDELEEVWRAKNSFRKSLRQDIRLLYAEEEFPEKQTLEGARII